MQTVTQKFSATVGNEKVELMVPTAVISEDDLNDIPRADIIAALNQSHIRGVRSAILAATKIEGATEESVTAQVTRRAGEFAIYRPGARGRGASNNATQKDAAEALKEVAKSIGRQPTKEELEAMVAEWASRLTA